ncbi:MAG TPA: YraN family protein [Candidatus Omnitrophota bacterium]|nr:YraN family protein [Candidatus Omnitrophota bacterium]HRZ14956.1 YraN family protein [Candidatus Omnitrophota bacterium]
MHKGHIQRGRAGEEQAAGFLEANGYAIVCRNYRNRFGEIDIIARHEKAVCFIEVKTRQSCDYGRPAEAVYAIKQRRIVRVATQFLKERGWLEERVRFDVVSIVLGQEPARIELIRDAFEAEPEV